MNLELIGQLVRLRYKLLWAKTRTRNGKIALFFAGYLLLVMVVMVSTAGGIGAGVLAVRSGKTLRVTAAALGGIYLQALLATVVLGFGMNAIFSDIELRRYPLRARDRRLTRHLIGVVDPFWVLFLALDLGIAFGLYLLGAGSLLWGCMAVLLLFVSNYLAARVVALLVDRLLTKKGGSVILMVSIMCLGFLPSILQPVVHKNSPFLIALVQVLKYTPPAQAAWAMTRADLSVLSGLGMLVCWLLALTAALVALERHPAKVRTAQRTTVSWGNVFERIGGLFGPRHGPLVAHWLRFYSRNNRFRTIYPLTLPLVVFLMFYFGRQTFGDVKTPTSPQAQFASALGAFAIAGFIGTGQFAVNQFGYVGGGLRRYLLLPTHAAAAFRAGSYTFLMLSAVLIPLVAIAWSLFWPAPFDARMLIMLVGSSVTSLFVFHGVGLWVSLLAPRRGNYYTSFGNDLSFAANVVVIGGMLGLLFLPRVCYKLWPAAMSPEHWWVLIPVAALAVVFYVVSLRSATARFRARREQLLAIMEGRG